MADITLDKSTTALLIADFYADMMNSIPHAIERGVVAKTQEIQQVARDAGVMVCYSQPCFAQVIRKSATGIRLSASEGVGPAGCKRSVAGYPSSGQANRGRSSCRKHRVNAMFGTDLEMALRANNIETVVMLGYATSGVVLSTTRYAADADFRLIIVEDCCSDQDPEVHDFLTQRIFPRQADVVSAADVIQAFSA